MQKNNFQCRKGCGRSFDSYRGRSIHESRGYHYVPPTPPEPKPKRHTDFVSLVRNTHHWGRKMDDDMRNSPSDTDLNFAIGFRIIELLEQLNKHLGVKE